MTATRCERFDWHLCVAGAHLPGPLCDVCGAPDPIEGEGPALRCPRCIRAMGRVVVEPYSVPLTVRQRLLERSLDVVALSDGAWRWTAAWPDAGDGTLMRGGRA